MNAAVLKKPVAAIVSTAPSGTIVLGSNEYGAPIHVSLAKLIEGRLLIQGSSGAGKSWTLRRILEQSASIIQQVIVDVEGEFETLAQELGHLYVDASKLDASAALRLGQRVREQRISVVLDISDIGRADQMIRTTAFLRAMVDAPKEMWHSCLVAIDEAHLLAPNRVQEDVPPSVRKASTAAIADVVGRGRKRGLLAALSTLRLARLATSVTAEAHNVLVGINNMDIDIRRAAQLIGWDASKGFDRLPMLKPGQFVATGAAFSQTPAVVNVGGVKSKHVGSTPAISAPAHHEDAHAALGIDELVRETAEAAHFDESAAGAGPRAIRMFIRSPGFALAGPVYEELKRLIPDGCTVKSLRKHLGCIESDLTAAIDLLQAQGVLELSDSDVGPVVRIDHLFARWRV